MTQQLTIPTMQPQIRMFNDEQIQEIHHWSLDILERTGIVMKNETAARLLLDAGCRQDGERIKIPSHLVTNAIATAPSRIMMHNRLGELTMPLEYGKVFFGPGSDCTFHHDLKTGKRRRAVAQDIYDIAHVCDALDQIDFLMSMGNPSDVPPLDIYIHEFINMIRGSVKPNVYTANNRRDMEDIFRIGAAVVGSEQGLREKPFFLLYAEPISPLLYSDESVDKLMFCAEKGIPVTYPPSPNTGGGGPITLAGALALGNAECLAGLVVHQFVGPGAPFLYGMNTGALDMRSTIVSYGAPEFSMGMAAYTDLGRYYNLPVWGTAGASDSKVVDTQFGAEASMSIMYAFLSRCNLVHDVGYLEYGSTSAVEAMVVCDEIIRQVRHMVAGIEINADTLAREAIHESSPGGGFLASDHTLSHWKDGQWQPDMIDRMRQGAWEKQGSKDMTTRARERARKILDEHKVAPLSDEAEKTIKDILSVRAKAG